jgi:GNAT superfamily N-acetyltransferase
MNPVDLHEPSDSGHAVLVSRVAAGQWHALENDLVIGRGEASRRSDGRLFVSVDAWHPTAFDQLAAALLDALPRPLHTMVDEADADLTAQWRRAGFTTRRREWEYAVPTGPFGTVPPPGVTVRPFGGARPGPLKALDRAIRDEAGAGWQDMPAEIRPGPAPDPSKYAVAEESGAYVGLLRVATVTRMPRIGLIAVRAGHRRRGIARALLAHTLNALHHVGKQAASAEVTESNLAATALFEGFGARRTGSSLELILR